MRSYVSIGKTMSELKRFFVEKVEEQTCLVGEEFEHAKNVLRLGVGDEVVLLDNSGIEYTAVIAKCEKKQMLLNLVGKKEGSYKASSFFFTQFPIASKIPSSIGRIFPLGRGPILRSKLERYLLH